MLDDATLTTGPAALTRIRDIGARHPPNPPKGRTMASRPRLIDFFCCGGGASMGHHLAGFEVIGVDKDPQPNYPFEFVQGDALDLVHELCDKYQPAAVVGSPPCQVFANVTNWRGSNDTHENLIPATRALFERTGLPWVIENVPEAAAAGALRPDLFLCGSMFGLNVRRHRVFETSPRLLQMTSPCLHSDDLLPFEHKNERAYADALGCTWMSAKEGRQAIPPAYTQYIGEQLMAHLEERAA